MNISIETIEILYPKLYKPDGYFVKINFISTEDNNNCYYVKACFIDHFDVFYDVPNNKKSYYIDYPFSFKGGHIYRSLIFDKIRIFKIEIKLQEVFYIDEVIYTFLYIPKNASININEIPMIII